MGLKKNMYWLGNFVFDLIKYWIFAIAAIIVLKIANADTLSSGDGYTIMCIYLIFFGYQLVLSTYVFG